MRNDSYTSITRVAWLADTGDEETDNENDKAMRNRGFMKAPASIVRTPGQTIRDWELTVRAILTTVHLTEGVDHWVRLKNVSTPYDNVGLMLDYFEIVPKGVITDPSKPEDKY
jgi:hypothetical protein